MNTPWCDLLREALDQSPPITENTPLEARLRRKQAERCLGERNEDGARKVLKSVILRADECQVRGKYNGRESACQAIYDKIRAALEEAQIL